MEYRQSTIDHHEAGDGIFIKTRNQQSILPGTLLGFFPGVIQYPDQAYPKDEKESVRNYVRRFDDYWINSETPLPFPIRLNQSYDE